MGTSRVLGDDRRSTGDYSRGNNDVTAGGQLWYHAASAGGFRGPLSH